ncbi:hypothetical protein, partial [Dialister hominis]|uniref:hypothetical protein n=1 Tax=Dialister hominis TaxID=2582419 RepID=UPI003AB5BCEB
MPAFWSGMVFYFPVLAFPGFPVFVFTGCMFSPRFSGRSVFPVVKVGDADKKLDQLTEVSGGQFMYSHEERLKAVKLHVDSGMGL